ncbi:MAG: signal peptidase-like protein, no function established [Candidatus Berkelbacteria bacterium]|nr:signal peptidase-like protein, no function established [Candidatus Berkelbacteria bacterium]
MEELFVKLATTGKIFAYKTDLKLNFGDLVLIEIEQIIEEGTIVKKGEGLTNIEEGQGTILRIFSTEDRAKRTQLKKTARSLIEETQRKVNRHSLSMKILDADISFDEKKLTFYFSADGRVDFRSLVSDLVKSYNKLIRLQQVGSRDEAKYFGGIGKCGRELCCTKFLTNLESCCGKLMCCLAYEADTYNDLKKKMPKIGSQFNSSSGAGVVVGHNILESKVLLETKDGKKIEVLI